jgi:two-component system sensor histidine kinase/response regulator
MRVIENKKIEVAEEVIPSEKLLENPQKMNKNLQDGLSFYSKYNVLLQTIKDGLVLISKRHVRYSNKVFAEILEYSIDEITGMKIDELIAPESKELVLERYEKRLNGEFVPSQYETKLITKTGRIVPVLLNTGLVSSDDEKLEFVIITDLSEISKKNIELRERESEFETIFNHTGVAIALLDINGNFIKVNDKWQDLFKNKKTELSVNTILDIFLPEEKNQFSTLVSDILSKKSEQAHTQLTLLNNEQNTFWADLSISAVKKSNEEIKYFIFSVLDISARIEIEARFEKERKLQEYFMEYLPDSIYFKDISSKFIKANKATLIKMGLNSLDELIGKTDHDLFDEAHAEEAKKDEQDIIKNGTSILNKVEKEIWHDGSVTWASTTKIPLRDEEDNIIGTFGITRDITKLKESEDIRNALYKISTAVAKVPDIRNLYSTIHEIIMDLMKADNFYIAMYNEESNTVSFPYFVDQIDPPPVERKAGHGLTEYILRIGEAKLIDAEADLKLRELGETSLIGEPTQIWLGVPLKVQGITIGVIVVQDYDDATTYGESEKQILTYVSEQIALAIDKKYREQKIIEYSDELKEVIATKDKFFSIIAHDLKSPFHGLLGLSRMIFEEYDSMDDTEVRSSIEILRDSTENTYKLIENLLDWSRLETGKMKFQPSFQNMFMLVEDTRMLLNNSTRLKNVTIRNKVSHTSLVWGDSNMLHSLLQNLISNSIKFTPKDGIIEVSELQMGDKIQYTVSDNGVGIEQKDIDKLFRLDVSFSTRGTMNEKGTGLGLVLCNEIVNIHGGEIKIQSEVDVGTKIIFTLNKQNLNK